MKIYIFIFENVFVKILFVNQISIDKFIFKNIVVLEFYESKEMK